MSSLLRFFGQETTEYTRGTSAGGLKVVKETRVRLLLPNYMSSLARESVWFLRELYMVDYSHLDTSSN